ncbi:hypothetical protein [Nocardia sp. NPDC057272]|uniref:hypothetical protein n=1 Tax=Nocardia sp. NPDC057272 TaxID=3346079 RepID=UPI0036341671
MFPAAATTTTPDWTSRSTSAQFGFGRRRTIRREFIGKPRDVKRICTSTASPLGRERYFEGHGLVDLVRAIRSV